MLVCLGRSHCEALSKLPILAKGEAGEAVMVNSSPEVVAFLVLSTFDLKCRAVSAPEYRFTRNRQPVSEHC